MISINNSIKKYFFLVTCYLVGKVCSGTIGKEDSHKMWHKSHVTFAVRDFFSFSLALPLSLMLMEKFYNSNSAETGVTGKMSRFEKQAFM